MKARTVAKNTAISLILLAAAAVLSLFLRHFDVEEHITTVFVFAVFLISLITKGYAYGLASAAVATLAINYIFTYPYFAFDFITPVNLVSALVMAVLSLLTGALTTKLKRHLSAKEEAQRERLRANLLRAVSHDLRTPLTAISLSASTLLSGGDRLGATQRDTMLRGIKDDSESLIRMVENLLSVTRLDNGEVTLEKSSVIVDELVDSAVTKFLMHHPEANPTVELGDEPLSVSADSLLIEQVIINLLENALFHAKSMTQLTLRVFPLNRHVVFEVADNGCGIPEDMLRHLFSGTVALHRSSPDSSVRSAGIGLTVCASIIRAHGGEISAENRKTGGALFKFTLDREDTPDGE